MENIYALHPETEIYRISLYHHELKNAKQLIMSSSKDTFLHLITAEIEESYGITIPGNITEKKMIFPLSSLFAGIYQKKLYVYFQSGRAVNYKAHYFFFNIKVR